ncbi:hypothetical protein QPK13_22905 [Photorhabdus tasmaniensis]
MTNKAEKENDRIQIRSFWISERQVPYVFNFLKKNDSSHRGDQVSLIRSAICTGLVLNNLFPDLSSFINGLNERLTIEDLNRFFNGDVKNKQKPDNELHGEINKLLDEKFNELIATLNPAGIMEALSSLQHSPVSGANSQRNVPVPERYLPVLEGKPVSENVDSGLPKEVGKEDVLSCQAKSDLTDARSVSKETTLVEPMEGEKLQNTGVTRKGKRKANTQLANLAR